MLMPAQKLAEKRAMYDDQPGYRSTALKVFRTSPRQYEAEYVLGTIKQGKKRKLDIGSAVHFLAMQPDLFEALVVEIPKDALTSNGQRRGKAWDAFAAENKDKLLLNSWEVFCVKQAARSILLLLGRERADDLINSGCTEVPLFWHAPVLMGVDCKALLDILFVDDQTVIDIKTTEKILPWEFSNTARHLQYGLQRHHHCEGVRSVLGFDPTWKWLVAEINTPFRARFYKASLRSREYWAKEWPSVLERIEEARLTGDYSDPGENDDMEIDL